MRDFTGFRFGQIHSEDLHLVVVSSSNRYVKTTMPAIKDYTTEVPGGNGSYLFGSTFQTQEFKVDVAFDSVDERTWRRISQLFSTDKPQDLVFDELPYKTYRAKLKSKPDFKFVCFSKDGERVYKGEGTLNFICYYPFAFGFNKYVVRAADYYKCNQPEEILSNSIDENPYKRKQKLKMLPGLIKDHYNVQPNMSTPWKGGYPSIEQVQWGELYFNNPTTGKKEMIDTRAYFKNVPQWQGAAQLLVSPTLDFDRDLIYMPQYSKTNYYNMDMGLNRQNGVIGNRILVYNPGDLPIDFEIKLGNLISEYRAKLTPDDTSYKFRISRYNVQRLTIEDAVDWCGLKPYYENEEQFYKYGTRYLTILEPNLDDNGEFVSYFPSFKKLGNAHPKHVYYVEPIPREKLGDYIRLFYWQTIHVPDVKIALGTQKEPIGNEDLHEFWEKGKEIANRYEELYQLCITDEERYELYWETLKMGILDVYNQIDSTKTESSDKIFGDGYSYESFVCDFINSPPEYIQEPIGGLNYGEHIFNITRYPSFMTDDYIQINSNDFDKIPGCINGHNTNLEGDYSTNLNRSTIKPLFLDFSKRMLYNVNEPEYESSKTAEGYRWQKMNEDKLKNFYDFKPTKIIWNDNIEQGHWFKIPPGWSLIDISPVINDELWGGKRWLDARPFDWGNNDRDYQSKFDQIYCAAAAEFLANNWDKKVNKSYLDGADSDIINSSLEKKREYFRSLLKEELEERLFFRRYITDAFDDSDYVEEDTGTRISGSKNTWKGLKEEIIRKRNEKLEYTFLKMLNDFWHVNNIDENKQPIGTIDDWWWYANNYLWANFPPVYWAYGDLLNKAEIKYTPLFY